MRLRQLWQYNKLVDLKLDKGYCDIVELDPQLVELFIQHVNERVEK